MRLRGIYTALITPFSGEMLDEEAFKKIVEWQISEGVDGIVPCGTTGEASTLSYEEHERVIDLAVTVAKGRIPVIAGTGSNSTKETIELTQVAKDLGVDGALLVAPYYNRPSQDGLYRHFKTVAESVDLPMVLYNIPTRTGVNMLPDLVARLAAVPNIIGIKEASGSLQQVADIFRLTKGEFSIISGDDNLFLPMMSVGATGVISVVSNVLPARMAALAKAFLIEGNAQKARDIHMELSSIFQTLFIEVNPVPVKESLYYMGMIEDKAVRLPLCSLADSSRATLINALRQYGLLRRQP